MTVLAVGYSGRGCHRHPGQQQQGRSDIMHTEQQQSQRGARACHQCCARLLVHACKRSAEPGEDHACCLVVQDGGAIVIPGSNTRVDLTSCALSSNEAKQVREHANQEQCRQYFCMQRSVLCSLVGACMPEECRSEG